jgi:hypothetical protein
MHSSDHAITREFRFVFQLLQMMGIEGRNNRHHANLNRYAPTCLELFCKLPSMLLLYIVLADDDNNQFIIPNSGLYRINYHPL